MALENKLGLTDEAGLARAEEKISKTKALALYDTGLLDTFPVGTFEGLADIHRYLFEEICFFAEQMRTVNIAKGNFRFAPVMYLAPALESIDRMPQSTFDEIIEKYVEMNVAHPFREGNGRSTRIWLDCILKKELRRVITCPTCGRTQYPCTEIANEVEKRLQGYKKSIKVAVMGCVVNGPGEAREADIGIAGGKGEAVLFIHGKPVKKLTGDNILDQFMDEIYKI